MQRSDPKMCSEASVADKIIRGCKLYLRPSASSVSFLCVHSLKGTGGSGVTSEQFPVVFIFRHSLKNSLNRIIIYLCALSHFLLTCTSGYLMVAVTEQNIIFLPFQWQYHYFLLFVFLPSHFSGCLQHLQHITCSRVKVLSKYGR